jgi:uncharacterized membrane protein YhaH (DUF805 family)
MDVGSLFFSFKGRINRAKFWLAILIFMVISLLLAAIGYSAAESMAFGILSVIVNIVVFISGLAVGIKRLHDRDRSGWWLLLFYIAPSVLFTLGVVLTFVGIEAGGPGIIGLLVYLAGVALLIWAIVELGCLRGTVGANQYGPDPLAQA